jgi:hypothetical protein
MCVNSDLENDLERRIRERAYHLWLEEGQPEGRAQDNWDLARELVAIEDGQMATTRPIRDELPGEPVEPLEALENAGEFPTMTDQGEMKIPQRRP